MHHSCYSHCYIGYCVRCSNWGNMIFDFVLDVCALARCLTARERLTHSLRAHPLPNTSERARAIRIQKAAASLAYLEQLWYNSLRSLWSSTTLSCPPFILRTACRCSCSASRKRVVPFQNLESLCSSPDVKYSFCRGCHSSAWTPCPGKFYLFIRFQCMSLEFAPGVKPIGQK